MARGVLAAAVACAALARMPVGVTGQKNIGSYDYIVVGSGPGGATVANYLTLTKKHRVLLLEAGPDLDTGASSGGTNTPKLEDKDAVARYFYSVPTVANSRAKGDGLYMGGRLMGGSSAVSGSQWIRPSDAYLTRLQEAARQVNNRTDPDWEVDRLKATLIELETFTGANVDASVHGTTGRVPVRMSPSDATGNGTGKMFADALRQSSGMGTIIDYNDPATPTGVFRQWQLSQTNDGKPASASNSMLGDARMRYNLFTRPRATVLNVIIDEKQTAKGVTFMQDGQLYMSNARHEVILAAGIRTSVILENSGIGSAAKIQQLLKDGGRKMVMDIPGVGEGLQNEGFLTMTFKKKVTETSAPPANPGDLYTGGGFLPFPVDGLGELYTNNATDCLTGDAKFKFILTRTERVTYGGLLVGEDTSDPLCYRNKEHTRLLREDEDEEQEDEEEQEEQRRQRRELHIISGNMTRFSQWFGIETPSTLTVSVVYLGAGSKGSVHIQSPDPTMLPLVNPNYFGGSHDIEYTCGMVQYQMLPFVEQLLSDNPDIELLSPSLEDLGKDEKGISCTSTLRWVFTNFKNAHHWFGSAKMDRRSRGGVVDTNGKVHGVRSLRIADASILPVKPDGGMQVPAYLIGATMAKKILAGRK